MKKIDEKLIDAYTILVLAEEYITNENDRVREGQLLVPEVYRQEIEIKVAKKTIKVAKRTMELLSK